MTAHRLHDKLNHSLQRLHNPLLSSLLHRQCSLNIHNHKLQPLDTGSLDKTNY